jgi:glutathione S-transferase
MSVKLVGIPLCPFVQRAAMVLNHVGIDYEYTVIDKKSAPSWFEDVSPLGKVPVLIIDGTSIFDSSVICEYASDVADSSLMPNDKLTKAANRSWIEFAGECMFDLYHYMVQPTIEQRDQRAETFLKKLDYLENALSETRFFNGDRMMLVDTAFAPMFQRLERIEEVYSILDANRFPKLNDWRSEVLRCESFGDAWNLCGRDELLGFLKANNSWVIEAKASLEQYEVEA